MGLVHRQKEIVMSEEARVIVTNPVIGLCFMQVCAVEDATEEEILRVANRENPSGTSNGWSSIVRDEPNGPGPCAEINGRIHYLLVC